MREDRKKREALRETERQQELVEEQERKKNEVHTHTSHHTTFLYTELISLTRTVDLHVINDCCILGRGGGKTKRRAGETGTS